MLLTAGWGTMWYALRMMKYAQRLMDNQRVRRGWGAHKHGAALAGGEAREPFECFRLCQDCSYLGEDPDRCPNCHGTNIYDLGDNEIAARLREWEEDERSAVPRKLGWLRVVLGVLGVAVVVVLFVLLAALYAASLSALGLEHLVPHDLPAWALWSGIAVGAVGFVVVQVLGGRWVTWMYYRLRPAPPLRWRRPVPTETRGTPDTRILSGRAKARGEPIEAPFSREPCLGYRALVMFDAKGDARPPQAMLDESRMTDVQVGSASLEAERTTLAGVPEPVIMDAAGFPDERLRRFMRKRGLFPQDGDLAFFEVRLQPDQDVQVVTHPTDTGVGPTVRA
jgi:hypothetical protein